MSTDGPKEGYAFVVETNQYAGNFEREMCAYVTGAVGECGVGKDMIIKDEITVDFDNIQSVADGNGCYRPASLCGKDNKDVAIYFYISSENKWICW